MNPFVKNILVTVSSAFLVSAVATASSVIITSKEHEIKIKELEKRVNGCESECDAVKNDIYKPSWDWEKN